MALTVTNSGSITSIITVGSVQVLLVDAAVGDMLIVDIAGSNSGTNGAASISGVTDSGGNTYTQRVLVNRDPGAVNEGTTLGGYVAPVTAAMTLGTITVSFSPDTPQAAVVVYRVQPSAGYALEYLAAGAGASGSSSTPSITSSSIASGETIIGLIAAEYDSAATGDADSTNGSWSTIYTAVANGGAGANYQCVGAQYKTVTGTGTQTFNPTLGASRDWAINYIVVREVLGSRSADAATSVDSVVPATAMTVAVSSASEVAVSTATTGAVAGVGSASEQASDVASVPVAAESVTVIEANCSWTIALVYDAGAAAAAVADSALVMGTVLESTATADVLSEQSIVVENAVTEIQAGVEIESRESDFAGDVQGVELSVVASVANADYSTIQECGRAMSTTLGDSLEIAGVTANVGDMLIVVIAADNAGTGGNNSVDEVMDDGANIYDTDRTNNTGSGVPNGGVTHAFGRSVITTALVEGTVTVSFSPDTERKVAVCYRVVPCAGAVLAVTSQGVTGGAGTSFSVTTTDIPNNHTVIGSVAIETDDTVTLDTDITGGLWGGNYGGVADTGADSSSITLVTQLKTARIPGPQTYNVSVPAPRYYAMRLYSVNAVAVRPTDVGPVVLTSVCSTSSSATIETVSDVAVDASASNALAASSATESLVTAGTVAENEVSAVIGTSIESNRMESLMLSTIAAMLDNHVSDIGTLASLEHQLTLRSIFGSTIFRSTIFHPIPRA